MKLTGTNTAIMTRVIDTIAPPSSRMASIDALREEVYPWSSFAWTPSTTTMASSTTMAMASTKAESVSKLIEKPMMYKAKKVPINATGMAMAGINVERKSCKKMYTTMNTRMKASINVLITSWIEAKRKSLTFWASIMPMPSGRSFSQFFNNAWMSVIIWVAFEPATCITIQVTDLWPFTLPENA